MGAPRGGGIERIVGPLTPAAKAMGTVWPRMFHWVERVECGQRQMSNMTELMGHPNVTFARPGCPVAAAANLVPHHKTFVERRRPRMAFVVAYKQSHASMLDVMCPQISTDMSVVSAYRVASLARTGCTPVSMASRL